MPTTRQQALGGELPRRESTSGAETLVLVAVGGVVVAALCVAAGFVSSLRGAPEPIVSIKATTVPRGSARPVVHAHGRVWVVNTKEGFRAFRDRCSRCESELRWDDSRHCFECAADGTLYGVDGLVLDGLTRVPLSEQPMRLEAGRILIRTR